MLRCPPTTIVLGKRDLVEYEKRQKSRREIEAEGISQQFARIAVGGLDGPLFGYEGGTTRQNRLQQKNTSEKDFSHSLSASSPISEVDPADGSSDLHETVGFETSHSTENPNPPSEPRPSPIKNEFDYGGFIESSLAQDADDTPQRSSLFSTPDDSSTPQHRQFVDSRRLRRPLPRSPLFLSQNATSPDGRLTTRLTPRVVSRVATHNSPGIIFAQPPRRPPRGSPRTLRHQTNSFSFDSSDRASAAYEQERVISNSTDDSTPHPSEDVNLHEELRGSSLQSSRASSGVAKLQDTPRDDDRFDAEEEAPATNLDFIFSSPAFPLPPPFSSVSRRTSDAGSLPSMTSDHLVPNPATSPVRSSLSTPDRDEHERAQQSPNANSVAETSETNESPPSGSRLGNFLGQISRIASYRTRSPLNRGESSSSPASTPPRTQTRHTPGTKNPRTPSRNYRVYNDSLSPNTQPQTPANLPEARHQSTYHPSYTAPVANRAQHGIRSIGATGRTRGSVRLHDPLYTPVRNGRRTDSPNGMRDEGFEGLYGGRENGDEEQNWTEGVRFNNAEIRSWGERDARNNGGSLRETPEPEDWRVGRRN